MKPPYQSIDWKLGGVNETLNCHLSQSLFDYAEARQTLRCSPDLFKVFGFQFSLGHDLNRIVAEYVVASDQSGKKIRFVAEIRVDYAFPSFLVFLFQAAEDSERSVVFSLDRDYVALFEVDFLNPTARRETVSVEYPTR